MEKTDKIFGIISVVAIICTVLYLFKSEIIFTVGNESLYAVGALFTFAIFAVFQHYFIIGFILRGRVKAFKSLASKYSLRHSYANNIFFIEYGKLNTLIGSVKGHTIEITDSHFKPNVQVFFWYFTTKSLNMDTKIYIDNQGVTPEYTQSWVLWRNPFMKVKEIESFVKKL